MHLLLKIFIDALLHKFVIDLISWYMYVQKAIQECEKDWADNKKLVDLRQKDIRKSVCTVYMTSSIVSSHVII